MTNNIRLTLCLAALLLAVTASVPSTLNSEATQSTSSPTREVESLSIVPEDVTVDINTTEHKGGHGGLSFGKPIGGVHHSDARVGASVNFVALVSVMVFVCVMLGAL